MNVVITGASKGIGKAIAEAFAGEGAALFLCARNQERLDDTAAELQIRFPAANIRVRVVDMSVKEEVKQFAAWCLQFGAPGILVNNAGEFLPGSICDETENNLEKMMAVNLYSAYHLTRALIPAMTAAKTGHIFNMCSVASLHAYKNGGGYSISKFALMGFSKNLREELKQQHIKVTTVYPGAVMTDSWAGFDNSGNRIMEATDIAAMILAASKLTPQANVEDIILRPLLGDL
ncbi:MAG TPA: SDR family oxidoreductase [Ferruginibacter sp.]|nr:SDR family oxidoreductase [Ferruginibacter sp.]